MGSMPGVRTVGRPREDTPSGARPGPRSRGRSPLGERAASSPRLTGPVRSTQSTGSASLGHLVPDMPPGTPDTGAQAMTLISDLSGHMFPRLSPM